MTSEPGWPNTSNTLVALLLAGEPICERCLTSSSGGSAETTAARLAQLKQDVRMVSATGRCWSCRDVATVLCLAVPNRPELPLPDLQERHRDADRPRA
jgi:hypothetical protein